MPQSRAVVVLTLLLSVACGGTDATGGAPDAGFDPNNPLQPPHPDDGVQFAFDTAAAPSEEIWKCLVGPIPGTDGGGFLPFNRVVSKQSPGMHHMDLALLLNVSLPHGVYDCADLYAEHPELMDETIIYASQTGDQELQLPPGVVANVPAAISTMLEVHYVNTTDSMQEVFTRVNAYWIRPEEVTETIWGGAVRDLNLNIPAGAQAHHEWTRCEMTEDIELLIVATHTHALGALTEVYLWDGAERGEMIYSNDDWATPYLKDMTTTPLHIPAGSGFEFHCIYDNPGAAEVNWGFNAADEMCNLALVHTPGKQTIECVPVETSDGLGL